MGEHINDNKLPSVPPHPALPRLTRLVHQPWPHMKVTGKELEQYKEPSSQVKRRRMLQFESEVLDGPLCTNDAFLRSED
ncbi:hypothetical protein PHJA_000617600 [Phtheirospermum japonicum]|uniref:Uncharacterized protein n=1 Tax=Phtheirospermum japonicum TaxID=374723 RepID=A0A830BCC6_9LAMI|nr:hypothetical protein PHJA_000617600 [Phtheirospermum japonicum]